MGPTRRAARRSDREQPRRRSIQGAVHPEGRCRHWHGPQDVLAIRLPCCDGFWACHACHEEDADHPAGPWPADQRHETALLCGACGALSTIAAYLAGRDACAACGQAFNPRCRLHHHRYFQPAEWEEGTQAPTARAHNS